jgi:RNA polymerase sigma factor (TIGR02999 family)
MNDVSRLLNAIGQGDPQAGRELLPLVYEELRRLAAQKLAQEPPGQTLQPTALVHEAYLRLVGEDQGPAWNSRGHFFAAAAEAMRRILVENARRKRTHKRGGGFQRHSLDDVQPVTREPDEEVLAIDEALSRFAEKDPVKAELVKLRYFAGCSIHQAADLLGLSPATAKRYWAYARAWLHQEITSGQDGRSPAQPGPDAK